jgi:hypothetical protein
MRTIDKILKLHNSNLVELDVLERDWHINWCGWEWINIDDFLREGIHKLKEYDKDLSDKLYEDIRIICLLHDRNYFLKKWFYYSNFLMARDIFLLLNWTSFFDRLFISIWLFFILNKFWKKFY